MTRKIDNHCDGLLQLAAPIVELRKSSLKDSLDLKERTLNLVKKLVFIFKDWVGTSSYVW